MSVKKNTIEWDSTSTNIGKITEKALIQFNDTTILGHVGCNRRYLTGGHNKKNSFCQTNSPAYQVTLY